MSRRRKILQQLHAYGDIGEILHAMRNLALMEVHKLGRFLAAQRQVVETIELAAADVLEHFPQEGEEARLDVGVLIGSERGFCGNFNDAILAELQSHGEIFGAAPLVVVGYRLGERLADDSRLAARLDGASVAEEIPGVLIRLVDALLAVERGRPGLPPRISVFRHRSEEGGVHVSALEPFPRVTRNVAVRHALPPLLHASPAQVLADLAREYLASLLHASLAESLLAENQRRMAHMDNAIRRLDQETDRLRLRDNLLRQEEITEEIEVLLLGADIGGLPRVSDDKLSKADQ